MQQDESHRSTVWQLPIQYSKVLLHPSVKTFAQELPRASWSVTWIQLLLLTVIRVVIAAFWIWQKLHAFTVIILCGILLALSFSFISVGLEYKLAKGLGGEGSFLGQFYTDFLYNVPLSIISGVSTLFLTLFPIAGSIFFSTILGLASSLYGFILNIFQIQASYRLTGEKATTVVLTTQVILFMFVFVIYIPLMVFILSAHPVEI